jgi:hypothetical protein
MEFAVLEVKIFVGIPCNALVAEKVVIQRHRHPGVCSLAAFENSHLGTFTICMFVFINSLLVNLFTPALELEFSSFST